MAEPARPGAGRSGRRHRTSLGRLAAAWLVVLMAAAAPFAATANDSAVPNHRVTLAAPPDETCRPAETQAAGGFDICSPSGVGGGGGLALDLGGLLPILGALVLGAGLTLAVVFLVLRRRAGAPLDPVDAGEWWTCRKCGRNNVVGSARCYGCGTWQG